MTAVRIENFGGRIPRMSSRLLPSNFAQVATDCKLFSGELRGWNQPKLVTTLTPTYTAKKVYRLPKTPDVYVPLQYQQSHLVEGTLINDAYSRVYWSVGSEPTGNLSRPQYNTASRISAGSNPYFLGVPNPTLTPTMTITAGSGLGSTVTRAFCFTYVSQYGEESGPSPIVTASGKTDDTWTLSGMGTETDVTAPWDGSESGFDSSLLSANGAKKRIYRTITSSSGKTTFFFVKELDIAVSSTDVSDTDDTIAYNNLLETSTWYTPPDDLEGIITHPNGFLVGFKGNDVYMSEPYRPHAWPTEYIVSTEFEIMGLGVVGTTIGIATKSNPYGLTGTHPANMALVKSNSVEPCLSKDSVVTLQDGIYYASNNGLARLTQTGAQVITQPIITKEEWLQDFFPDEINATRYATRYLAFNSAGTNGFIIDPTEARISVVDLTYDGLDDIYIDNYSGLVHVLYQNKVYEWDPATSTVPIVYTWRSKVYEFPKPLNLGAGIVKLDDSSFTVDASFIASIQAANAKIFAAAPLNPVASRPVAGRKTLTNYKTDLEALGFQQTSAVASTDLIRESDYTSLQPSVSLKVYADGREVFNNTITKDQMFRLPFGYKAHTYEFEISSNTDVYSMAFAETGKELMKV